MSNLLVATLVVALRLPAAETFQAIDWVPSFTEPSELRIADSTLAILTHSSRAFDPLQQTRPAVCKVVSTMKAASLPVVYLHDRHNPGNPAWMYLYDDWQPTAIVGSDVGHLEADLSHVDHVICLGGYYEQCERSTVRDVIRLWHRDGRSHDLHLTQIVDGTFSVGQYLRSNDKYAEAARAFQQERMRKHGPKSVLSVDEILANIVEPEDQLDFLLRQFSGLPDDVNIVIEVFSERFAIQVVCPDAPVLTIAYRRSDNFLAEIPLPIDWSKPAQPHNHPHLFRNFIAASQPKSSPVYTHEVRVINSYDGNFTPSPAPPRILNHSFPIQGNPIRFESPLPFDSGTRQVFPADGFFGQPVIISE